MSEKSLSIFTSPDSLFPWMLQLWLIEPQGSQLVSNFTAVFFFQITLGKWVNDEDWVDRKTIWGFKLFTGQAPDSDILFTMSFSTTVIVIARVRKSGAWVISKILLLHDHQSHNKLTWKWYTVISKWRIIYMALRMPSFPSRGNTTEPVNQ